MWKAPKGKIVLFITAYNSKDIRREHWIFLSISFLSSGTWHPNRQYYIHQKSQSRSQDALNATEQCLVNAKERLL